MDRFLARDTTFIDSYIMAEFGRECLLERCGYSGEEKYEGLRR